MLSADIYLLKIYVSVTFAQLIRKQPIKNCVFTDNFLINRQFEFKVSKPSLFSYQHSFISERIKVLLVFKTHGLSKVVSLGGNKMYNTMVTHFVIHAYIAYQIELNMLAKC